MRPNTKPSLQCVGRPFGTGRLLAEELLEGDQVTVEGYAFGGEVHVVGIVDAVMFPGTQVFQRFQYPSQLPESVQERMALAAAAVMRGIRFHHGFFNVEMVHDPRRDAIHIIEINPRLASQFADLYEKVDGFNTYNALLDLALGLIDQWPAVPQAAARKMLERYGLPDEATPSRLIWFNNSPWKRTIVYRDEIPHNFPKPHTNVLEEFIDHQAAAA